MTIANESDDCRIDRSLRSLRQRGRIADGSIDLPTTDFKDKTAEMMRKLDIIIQYLIDRENS